MEKKFKKILSIPTSHKNSYLHVLTKKLDGLENPTKKIRQKMSPIGKDKEGLSFGYLIESLVNGGT
jgi:hypothetical protein